MGLLNPSLFFQGGDTLADLRDRYAQVKFTSSLIGNALATQGGTATAPTGTSMAVGRYTTTTTLNNIASGQGSSLGQTYGIPYRITVFQVRMVQLPTCRAFIGVASATGNSWNSDTPANDGYGFRYSTNASDTTWKCVNNGGGTNTVTNSLITVTTNPVLLAVEAIGSTKINFYINRVLVATNSTNLPRTSVTNYSNSAGICCLAGGTAFSLDVAFVADRMHAV